MPFPLQVPFPLQLPLLAGDVFGRAARVAIPCALAGLVLALSPCAAQETRGRDEEKRQAEAALQQTRAAARDYTIQLRDSGENPFVMRPEPILQWSNPERGQVYGNVFLWTRHGRPVVVGSLFQWFSPFTHSSHEFHSLAAQPIRARYQERVVWTTQEPGLQLAELPDAGSVPSSAAGRMARMRQLARQFSVRSTQRDGQQTELRLLPQAVYRYEPEGFSAGVEWDGALFVFVQGTDPEMWLLLEASRTSDGGEPKWQCGLARMNSIELTVEREGKPFTRFPQMPFAEISSHSKTYTSFLFKDPATPPGGL